MMEMMMERVMEAPVTAADQTGGCRGGMEREGRGGWRERGGGQRGEEGGVEMG